MGWRVGLTCIYVGVAEAAAGVAREDHHGGEWRGLSVCSGLGSGLVLVARQSIRKCVYGDGVAINLCCENGGENVLAISIVVEIAGRVDRRIYSTPTIDHEFRFTGTIPSSMH